MPYITSAIDPAKLIGYVRGATILQGPTLSNFLPKRTVPDLEYELQNYESPYVNIARYRAWDTPSPLGKRAGLATVRGEILPLGLAMTKNEKEVLRLTKLEQAVSGSGAAQIYDDALNCGLACESRVEIARAGLLTTGKVTLNEGGVTTEADFGVPAGHFLTAGTPWTTTATATPIANLIAYEATYAAANGGRYPDAWLISSSRLANLQQNLEIRTMANAGGGVPAILSQDEVARILRVAGIHAPFVAFDGMVPDANGVATRTLNVAHLIAVRDGMGEVLVGTHPMAELSQLAGTITASFAPGIMTWVEEYTGPVRVTTVAEIVALPVLRDPKALFRVVI